MGAYSFLTVASVSEKGKECSLPQEGYSVIAWKVSVSGMACGHNGSGPRTVSVVATDCKLCHFEGSEAEALWVESP